ncbi:MAG: hypothetical protein ACR9NN_09755 [Nostochopsis sp.]
MVHKRNNHIGVVPCLFKSGTGVELDTGLLADECLDLWEETGLEEVLSVILLVDLDWLNVGEFLSIREFRSNQLRFAETSDLRTTAIIFLKYIFCAWDRRFSLRRRTRVRGSGNREQGIGRKFVSNLQPLIFS